MIESNHKTFDVIIIGAGSIGTPAAFYFANAGYRTLVIDSAGSVGQGSNKRAIGGIRATHSDPAKISLCKRSIEVFSTWKDAFGEDIEWVRGGYGFVAYRPEEEKTLKDLLVIQQQYGLNIKWLNAPDLLEKIPDLNRKNLIGGTLSPDDGNASPLLAIHAFYSHAKLLGADFHFNEQVTNINIQKGKVQSVQTSIGEYFAPVVINAAGGFAHEIGKMSGLDLPVHPDCHEAAITEPVAHFLDPMIVDIRPAPGSTNFYFYQHYTGQIVFCITPNPSIWGTDTRETSQFLPMVSKRMIEIMPRLKDIRVRRTWRGLYPMTPDGFPFIGWVKEIEGLLLAVGMCGQGFMLGPGVGELLVRLVSGQNTAQDRETLRYTSAYRKFAGEEKLR